MSIQRTNKILIIEKPLESYELELKDGKPFNGYEVTDEKLFGEFPFVNYYENGELKIKYSVDILAKDQYEPPIEYSLKTTYDKNKVVSGNVYRNPENGVLLTDQYLNGKQIGLNVDIIDMHYFNRLSFKIDNDQLSIKTLENKDEVRIYKKDNWIVADYCINGEIAQHSEPIYLHVEDKTPQSVAVFYKDKNNKVCQINIAANPKFNPIFRDEFLFNFYSQFAFEYSGELSILLGKVNNYFSTPSDEMEIALERLFEDLTVPYTEETILAHVNFDQEGQFKNAILFNNTTHEKYHQFKEVKQLITDPIIINELFQLLKEDCNL